jgi:putative hydrolase of the HAD superfamily
MVDDGVRDYFKVVILSSKVGLRKPNPEIYLLASRLMGVEPGKCAYLGDNPIRDEEGTRAAGYGMFILFEEPATLAKEPGADVAIVPDHTVRSCRELLDIFPPRN